MRSAQGGRCERPLAILLAKTGAFVEDELRTTLADTGLRPRHCQLLMHLSEAECTSQQELLELLDLDASVLVGLLNDLEREGLVQRTRDTGDRRRHIVELTGEGVKELAALQEMVASVEATVLAGLSERDRGTLRRVLQSIWSPTCQGR
jgi:DNA-binding MarR family transcriptional regulator